MRAFVLADALNENDFSVGKTSEFLTLIVIKCLLINFFLKPFDYVKSRRLIDLCFVGDFFLKFGWFLNLCNWIVWVLWIMSEVMTLKFKFLMKNRKVFFLIFKSLIDRHGTQSKTLIVLTLSISRCSLQFNTLAFVLNIGVKCVSVKAFHKAKLIKICGRKYPH